MIYNRTLPIFLALTAAGALSANLAAAEPKDARIVGAKVLGKNCGLGSRPTFSENGQALTVIFNDFRARIGDGEGARGYLRTFCRVNIDVQVPSGYRFAVLGVDYRGYVDLQESMTASHWLAYGSDADMVTFPVQKFYGPVNDVYSEHVSLVAGPSYSRCDSQTRTVRLKLHNVIDVTGQGNQGGSIGVDSLDSSIKQPLRLQLDWKTC